MPCLRQNDCYSYSWAYEPRGGELQAAAPLTRAKTIIFRAKAKFLGQKPAAKKYIFVFIKRKNGIHYV